MSTLNELKEKAERLCPYPIGSWRDTKYDLRAQSPDSAFADCEGRMATVSVMVRPPEGVSHIALIENGETVPLVEDPGPLDQLGLFEEA